jgi:large subunit ribosomal protein L35
MPRMAFLLLLSGIIALRYPSDFLCNFKVRRMTVPRKQKSGKLKLKTHKATSKRFRMTGSGKVVRSKGGKSHLRRKRSARALGMLDQTVPVQGESIKQRVKRLAPYMEKNN